MRHVILRKKALDRLLARRMESMKWQTTEELEEEAMRLWGRRQEWNLATLRKLRPTTVQLGLYEAIVGCCFRRRMRMPCLDNALYSLLKSRLYTHMQLVVVAGFLACVVVPVTAGLAVWFTNDPPSGFTLTHLHLRLLLCAGLVVAPSIRAALVVRRVLRPPAPSAAAPETVDPATLAFVNECEVQAEMRSMEEEEGQGQAVSPSASKRHNKHSKLPAVDRLRLWLNARCSQRAVAVVAAVYSGAVLPLSFTLPVILMSVTPGTKLEVPKEAMDWLRLLFMAGVPAAFLAGLLTYKVQHYLHCPPRGHSRRSPRRPPDVQVAQADANGGRRQRCYAALLPRQATAAPHVVHWLVSTLEHRERDCHLWGTPAACALGP